MLFNSYIFIFLFLPVTWIGYFYLGRRKWIVLAKSWLLAASLFFYAFWNINYLPLILISVLFNYALTNQMLDEKVSPHKKKLFYAGLIFNIGLLGYFKYTNFFLENVSILSGLSFEMMKIVLPLGISFYTLQQVAYLVDVYQGIAGEKRLLDYALFVVFFPQLIAGPIVHYDEIMPQIQSLKLKLINKKNIALGLFIFTIGLSKKVLIADTLSVWVSEAFKHAETLHFFAAWGASLGYTLQLYFDFSGYSDMAIGLGYLFNMVIPQNFNSPLRAGNINDFWARWHMTLSAFIRTYIFTPLVRIMPKPTFRYSMVAIFTAMVIAGIWHGAAWTFVFYGVIHGLAIVIHHNWKKKKKKLSYFWAWLLTFNFINIAFVIFRAQDMKQAFSVIAGMLGLHGIQLPKMGIKPLLALKDYGVKIGPYMTNDENFQLLLILLGFLIIFKADNANELKNNFKPGKGLGIVMAFLFVFSLFGLNRVSEFIYFNF